ncbi:MAG: Crp/Fnr family transcriptional regulator [Proteobacteria bacterium]|nr:Crp/Fnr family transcriptional regulator [Pseudomonadota bacterium]
MSTERTLNGTRLLASVPEERIAVLDGLCRWRSFEQDDVILNLDDDSSDIYFIAHGEVRVTVFSQTGRTVIMRDFKTGDHFGEFAAVDGEPRSASIIALNRTVVAQMPAPTFMGLVAEFPEISLAMMRAMTGAIRSLNERVVEFSTLGVRNRIHAELLRLARSGRVVDGTGRISPPPTHAEIASRISTHREAVTRELKQLENQELLERTRGAFVIKDLAELERMVEDARAGRSE